MNYTILTSMTNEEANKLDAQSLDGENIQKITLEMLDIMAEYPSEFIAVKINENGEELGARFYCDSFDYLADLATSKNGCDLVKYEGGQVGLIGRENNYNKYFKILREASYIEQDERQPIEELRKEWAQDIEDIKKEANEQVNALDETARKLWDLRQDVCNKFDEMGLEYATELGLNNLIDYLAIASKEVEDIKSRFKF